MNQRIYKYLNLAQQGKLKVCIWGAGNVGVNFGRKLIEKWKINIDFYCDNDYKKWGKEICDGIKCFNPSILENKQAVCFVMVSNHYCEDIVRQASAYKDIHVITYNDMCVLEGETYFEFQKRKQIAIYTCIVGAYDEVMEPVEVLKECDYYLIADHPLERESVFKYIDIKDVIPKDITDFTRINRYCKINAHKIFQNYRYSIYFDGNIQLRGNIVEEFEKLPQTRITTICKNFFDSIYVEAMRAIEHGRDSKSIITQQVEKYWLEGMPEDFGSVACGIILREHNNPICVKIMEDWWNELKTFSKRDQISFPYVIWKNGFSIKDVGTLNDFASIDGKYWAINREHTKARVENKGMDSRQ